MNTLEYLEGNMTQCKKILKNVYSYHKKYNEQLRILKEYIRNLISQYDIVEDVYEISISDFPDSGLMITIDLSDNPMPYSMNIELFIEMCEKNELTIENIKKYSY